ncbi:type I 3-dehydroquinate dehydratase [Enterococcus hermanniensis]|uniref:type I 3-dehydroquinate dehydratase n=1 Tax=Enterococcus hermanniensis TaxID=249189 RepID=UPI00090029AF|nr:type I 3-dehydroquinate dehydratase [Enterococcus hermanniensis]
MKKVSIDNVVFGEGIPKIIVPLVGKTKVEILQEIEIVAQSDCDVVEWRIDHYEKVLDFEETATFSKKVKQAINKPLLITFRTVKEGGVCPLQDEKYFELYHALMERGDLDLLDIELFMPTEAVKKAVSKAHEKGIKVIMCNHDFDKTPTKEEIIQRLRTMQEKEADICKIAVMPQNTHDVIVLLDATQEMYHNYADRPLITMAMGKLGVVSRVSGATFGSSATFGAAKQVSAPGQVSVNKLKNILTSL